MTTPNEYLMERGFRRGRFCDFSRDVHHITEVSQPPFREGWIAFTTVWEIGPFPDPETAYIAAELADWGRT